MFCHGVDEEELDDDDEDGEGAGSKKKLFIIIGVVVVLVIGGLAGAYFAGLFDSLLGSEKKTESMSGEAEGGEGGVLRRGLRGVASRGGATCRAGSGEKATRKGRGRDEEGRGGNARILRTDGSVAAKGEF